MIRYALACEGGHAFEAWFRSSDDYDGQSERKLIGCPACGSDAVAKALMAPSVATSDDTTPVPAVLLGDKEAKLREMIRHVRQEVTQNAENVGPRFAGVARQMHEGEIDKASVYGIASAEDVRALADDGVEFHPLPVLPDDAN